MYTEPISLHNTYTRRIQVRPQNTFFRQSGSQKSTDIITYPKRVHTETISPPSTSIHQIQAAIADI